MFIFDIIIVSLLNDFSLDSIVMKKKFILPFLLILCALTLLNCSRSLPTLAGGYGTLSELSEKEIQIFQQVIQDKYFVKDWKVLQVSRQVVAGTNYHFICSTPQGRQSLYVFVPLPGRGQAQITGVAGTNNAAEVVVEKSTGEVVGRYVSETETDYVIDIQDQVAVPKSGKEKTFVCAAAGQGFVYPSDFGKWDAYEKPNARSKTVATIEYEEGELPESFRCLGIESQYYKVQLDGKIAYLPIKSMHWDPMNTF